MKKKALVIATSLALMTTGCAQTNTETTSDNATTQTVATTSVESTTEAAESTVQKVTVNGHDYVYGTEETLNLDGKSITGTLIGDTGIYYAAVDTAETGMLYGVTPMSYYTYYAAELDRSVEDLKTDTAYDAITSASSPEGSHAHDYPTIIYYREGTDVDADPMTIDGLEVVDISVDAEIYAKGMILVEAQNESPLADAVARITLNEDATKPAYNNYVKALNEDGTYGKGAAVDGGEQPMDLSNITVTPNVVYNSHYGNYCFQFYMEGFDMEDETAKNSWVNYMNNIYDVTIKDAKGNIAGGIYYQDIWVEHGKQRVELAVANGDFEVSGNAFTSERYKDFFKEGTNDFPEGDYTVTIKSRGYEDITSTVTVATRLTEEQVITSEDQIWQDGGNTVVIDASTLPEDFVDGKVVVENNRKKITEGTDFTYDAATKTLVILDTDMTGVGEYKIKLIDDKYQPAELSIVLKSTMTSDQISYDGDKVVMAEDSPATVAEYLKNIRRIYMYEDGQAEGDAKRIRIKASKLFNEDGTINFDSTARDEAIFEDGKTYHMMLKARGYDDVTLDGIVKK